MAGAVTAPLPLHVCLAQTREAVRLMRDAQSVQTCLMGRLCAWTLAELDRAQETLSEHVQITWSDSRGGSGCVSHMSDGYPCEDATRAEASIRGAWQAWVGGEGR